MATVLPIEKSKKRFSLEAEHVKRFTWTLESVVGSKGIPIGNNNDIKTFMLVAEECCVHSLSLNSFK